jgi:ABC-type multidrug transport system fused ATPase/permease subunit
VEQPDLRVHAVVDVLRRRAHLLVWVPAGLVPRIHDVPILRGSHGMCLLASAVFARLDARRSSQSTTFGAIQAGNVFSFVPDISSARGAAEDILKLVDSVPEIDAESEAGKKPDPEKIRGQIRLDGIHFRYPTRPQVRVLRNLSLTVEPGTFIALVGASGSGKSTVYVGPHQSRLSSTDARSRAVSNFSSVSTTQ